MVKVKFDSNNLVLTVLGMHKVWTLKSDLEIPLSHIKECRINNNELSRPAGWRAPGTYIPGLITAGTYRAHEDRVFWDVVSKDKSIIIDLKDDYYKQIVIEVDSPESVVQMINAKLLDARH